MGYRLPTIPYMDSIHNPHNHMENMEVSYSATPFHHPVFGWMFHDMIQLDIFTNLFPQLPSHGQKYPQHLFFRLNLYLDAILLMVQPIFLSVFKFGGPAAQRCLLPPYSVGSSLPLNLWLCRSNLLHFPHLR